VAVFLATGTSPVRAGGCSGNCDCNPNGDPYWQFSLHFECEGADDLCDYACEACDEGSTGTGECDDPFIYCTCED
jgi:hypothetical protein